MTTGDRLWIWLADEPSTFEIDLAEALIGFSKSMGATSDDHGVFYVSGYSWRGGSDFTYDFLKTHLPQNIELPQPRMIRFLTLPNKVDFSIPVSTLSFSHCAEAGAP